MLFMRTFLLDTHRHCPDLSEAWPALMAPKRKAWEVVLKGGRTTMKVTPSRLPPHNFLFGVGGFKMCGPSYMFNAMINSRCE